MVYVKEAYNLYNIKGHIAVMNESGAYTVLKFILTNGKYKSYILRVEWYLKY